MNDQNKQYPSLDEEWGIKESSFDIIKDIIKRNAGKNLIEFGSGASTIRLLQEFPNLNITTIEHESEFYRKLMDNLAKQGQQDKINAIYSPLKFCIFYGKLYKTYSDLTFNQNFDIVIIDGPPTHYTKRGREACLYTIINNLHRDSIIILDDYNRREEKKIVKNWMSSFPEQLTLSVENTGNHLAILRVLSYPLVYKFDMMTYLDNLKANWQLLKSSLARLKNSIRKKIVQLFHLFCFN